MPSATIDSSKVQLGMTQVCAASTKNLAPTRLAKATVMGLEAGAEEASCAIPGFVVLQ